MPALIAFSCLRLTTSRSQLAGAQSVAGWTKWGGSPGLLLNDLMSNRSPERIATSSCRPKSASATARRNGTMVARTESQAPNRAALARPRASAACAPSIVKGSRITEDRRLLSLDSTGGSRNVRRIEIDVPLERNESQARSSVEEHYLDTVGVGGSIPPVPTTTLPPQSPVVRRPG